MTTRTDLGGTAWTVRLGEGEAATAAPEAVRTALLAGIPAAVPGVVHLDLLEAGLIPDPYLGRNEAEQTWVGDQSWTYTTHFTLADGAPELTADRTELVCDGLDTLATVVLNGQEVARTANQHRSYRFAVGSMLHAGDNTLEITFAPALAHMHELEESIGAYPHVEKHPFNLIRKMACNFGWDWGPALITAGIWKAIGLESWNAAHVASATVLATTRPREAGGFDGVLDVALDLDGELRFAGVTVRVSGAQGLVAEAGFPAEDGIREQLVLSEVDAWWPHSLGEQPLYDVEIVLHNDTAVLDTLHRRVGFRSVALDTTPDENGGGARFAIAVNGVEVFARGANWIPDDCFLPRVTPVRYRERIGQARDANIDLLRVWGGGIYEDDAFFAACDELGVMVWQDILLACAAYPEVEPIRSELEAEVRENVVRLSAHPSLIMWNGCNENLWGFETWGWIDELAGRGWGADYYYRLFPEIIAELDPSRPYWFGSPASGHLSIHPNNPNYGTVHVWDVWNNDDYTHYSQYSPRFVAEFGFQGPATWATWDAVLPADERFAESATVAAHEKAQDGMLKLERGLAEHLDQPAPGPEGFDDWLFLTQLNQARAVRFGIEWWRSMRGRCMGTVVWQLNDCWPTSSWSALDLGRDSAGHPVARRKPLWHALRSVYADRLLTIQPTGETGWQVVLVNDGQDAWVGTVAAELRQLDGTVVASVAQDFAVDARAAVRLDLGALGAPTRPTAGLALVATAPGAERAVRLLAEDKDAELPAAEFEVQLGEGGRVTVTARSFLRSICLFADRLGERAEADTAMVDLFPGEHHTFLVENLGEPDHQLLAHPALRMVNDRTRETPGVAPVAP
ncbi:MAG: glycoside hydrolase family 2 protein [Microbacteriaceae bacterium]|nr:glycoside hydrolase family 2 protein [Microbacteriaceae bacterium]